MTEQTCLRILGINKNASEREVFDAYKRKINSVDYTNPTEIDNINYAYKYLMRRLKMSQLKTNKPVMSNVYSFSSAVQINNGKTRAKAMEKIFNNGKEKYSQEAYYNDGKLYIKKNGKEYVKQIK